MQLAGGAGWGRSVAADVQISHTYDSTRSPDYGATSTLFGKQAKRASFGHLWLGSNFSSKDKTKDSDNEV